MKKSIKIILALIVCVIWGWNVFNSPHGGATATWIDDKKGFIRFQANEEKAGYILVSHLNDKDVKITDNSSIGWGIIHQHLTIKTPDHTEQYITITRNSKIIIIDNYGNISVSRKEISIETINYMKADLIVSLARDNRNADSVMIAEKYINGQI
ncbi:MAG: hypothetical protein KAU94_10365 [Verrucomicrobia bacterium]|nr:hypothetical protein [Verrucomicrobiota bacterium]